MSNILCLIGAPFKYGQPKDGVNYGPKVIKERLRRDKFAFQNKSDNFFKLELEPKYILKDYKIHKYEGELDTTIRDLGDFIPDIIKHNDEKDILNYNISIANIIKENLEKNHKVLTIGGDHSIAIGSINGVLEYNPDTLIVWVDAHADINTINTSPSGNMHGMPVAYLTGLQNIPDNEKYEVLKPKLNFQNLVYIGIRDLDEGEIKILKDNNILAFWGEDVKKMGIETIINEIFYKLDFIKKKNIHLSFDIDGIDPLYAPSTGTTAEGGLNKEEMLTLCQMLKDTGKLKSMDLVEVNPTIGTEEDKERTINLAVECVKTALI